MSGGRDGMLRVIWRGPGEAALFKPAGLSSERPATAAPDADSFIVRARRELGWADAQLPHRLDRPTSGILFVAADRAQVAVHAEEQRQGLWTKWYLARIPSKSREGRSAAELFGRHRAFIRRRGRLAECVRSGGDPAFLEVLAVEPSGDRPAESHALIRLDTGRFHQIRAMLAHQGFPLVGDAEYGSRLDPKAFELVAAGIALDRPAGRIALEVLDSCRGLSDALAARLRQALSEPPAQGASPDPR